MSIWPRRNLLFVTISMAVMLAVTGCAASTELMQVDPTESSDEISSDTSGGPGYVPPLIEDLPTCDAVFGILGELTVDLVPEQSEDDVSWGDSAKYGLSCAWLTKEALSDNVGEQLKASGVGVQIIIEENPLVEADYAEMGMIVDDPRMADIGGLLVVPGGELELAGELGLAGPAVVVGPVHITLAVVGAFLSRNDDADNLTNDQAINGAIALHKALAE